MAQMNMVQAINSAMDIMLSRDPDVVLLGEDIGYFGGVFRCTDGLQRKYGEQRVLDTPIAEGGILGAAIGMGVNGLRPVVEIQFADYIYPAFDQLTSTLARLRYRSGGDFFAPVTIRTPCGGGIRGGQTHSQSPEGIFTHVCGVKVVMPSNPYDAKGLLISSIEDDDPVIFFEPKRLYNGPFDGDPNKPAVPWSTRAKGEVPDGYYSVPIGKAEIVRKGADVTVLTYGTLVHVAEAAAQKAQIDAEIIDVRTMVPLDVDTICTSVKKTGRCVVAHEATGFSGYGAELSATVQEECFWSLRAPITRVTGWDTPYPHIFEWDYFPGPGARDGGAQGGDGGVGMSRFEFKLPDLGEGTIDAEIVEWHVKPGDHVIEDDVIVDVMTEKANIEVPSPVTGTVLTTTGEPGDLVPVGSVLIVFETDAGAKAAATSPATQAAAAKPAVAAVAKATAKAAPVAARAKPVVDRSVDAPVGESDDQSPARSVANDGDVLTSPSIRRRAREAGVDLSQITGSGAEGRITQADFEAALKSPRETTVKSPARAMRPVSDRDVEEIKVIGVRRLIAQRLSESKRSIPHFAYVEEIDITELDALRVHLNAKRQTSITYLPFLALALIRALPEFPQCNSHYDAERGVLLRHRACISASRRRRPTD